MPCIVAVILQVTASPGGTSDYPFVKPAGAKSENCCKHRLIIPLLGWGQCNTKAVARLCFHLALRTWHPVSEAHLQQIFNDSSISSALLVQMNSLGFSLYTSRHCRMAASRFPALLNDPRRICLLVICANHRSTRATAAIACQMARISWAVLSQGAEYDPRRFAGGSSR